MRFLAGLALAATLLTTTLPALAQSTDPGSPPPAGQRQGRGAGLQKLLDQLNLTPDQQAKIQLIRQDNTLKGKARMDAISAVLTPDQRQKLHDLMQQARQNRQNRQGGPGGGGPPPAGGGGGNN